MWKNLVDERPKKPDKYLIMAYRKGKVFKQFATYDENGLWVTPQGYVIGYDLAWTILAWMDCPDYPELEKD